MSLYSVIFDTCCNDTTSDRPWESHATASVWIISPLFFWSKITRNIHSMSTFPLIYRASEKCSFRSTNMMERGQAKKEGAIENKIHEVCAQSTIASNGAFQNKSVSWAWTNWKPNISVIYALTWSVQPPVSSLLIRRAFAAVSTHTPAKIEHTHSHTHWRHKNTAGSRRNWILNTTGNDWEGRAKREKIGQRTATWKTSHNTIHFRLD